jgi:hypothetical protein
VLHGDRRLGIRGLDLGPVVILILEHRPTFSFGHFVLFRPFDVWGVKSPVFLRRKRDVDMAELHLTMKRCARMMAGNSCSR